LLLKDGTTAYVYGPGDLPLEQVSGTSTNYFHHDQLGSTRIVTDSSGTTQATYTFDPYGNLSASTGTVANPFLFTGQYRDSESGLYYLRARYYDPVTGQFLSRDPITSTTRQPYSYVSGSPLNRTDPTGLCGWDFWTCNWQAAGRAFVDSAKAQDWTPDYQGYARTFGGGPDRSYDPDGLARAWMAIGGVLSAVAGGELFILAIENAGVTKGGSLVVLPISVGFATVGALLILGCLGFGPLGKPPSPPPMSGGQLQPNAA
jgi:RHS repeat-associated protein